MLLNVFNFFFGSYDKQITNIRFRNFQGILIVFVIIVNADIDGLA